MASSSSTEATTTVTAPQSKRPFKLSYIDFPPRCAGAGGVICVPDYERFDVLVSRANDWLRLNAHLRVNTCESIEVKGRVDGVVDTNKSCFFEADHTKRRMRNMYIRALRLWIVPKEDGEDPQPQQIGYVNVVPTRSEFGLFDSFSDTVRKFNQHLRTRPIPGCVLNIESQEMKFHESDMGVDPDESCWVESVKYNLSFLVVIRVFYELGPTACEEIGCADFVPSKLNSPVQFAVVPIFENFREVVRKASSWVQHQQHVRITNVQSIDYKLRHDAEFDEIDTQRSFFVESGRCATRYLRILRISFVKPFDGREVIVERPLLINYATFEPLMLSSGGIFGIPLFENLSQTMKRAMVWLQTSNPDLEIVACETVPIRMFSGNQYGDHEVTYTWNRGDQKEYWIFVLRIYVSGHIEVPPPENVSPCLMDKADDSACCALL